MFPLCSIYHEGEVLRLSSVDYAAIGLIQVPQGVLLPAMIMMINEIISVTAT